MSEKPKETGAQIVERWRRGVALSPSGGVIYCGEARALPMGWCADELATFLEGLREAVEEAGVALADAEIACGMQHSQAFAALSKVRQRLGERVADRSERK